MWQIISNISSIITCILFIAYIIGRIWQIKISKELLYEKFQMEYLSGTELEMLNEIIELDGENNDYGEIFSISSPNGIRKIRVYNARYDSKNNRFIKESLIDEIEAVNVDEKIYFRTAIPCGIPNKFVEIDKCDYVKICFAIGQSGKNGEFVRVDYKCKLTFKSWIYYLCK